MGLCCGTGGGTSSEQAEVLPRSVVVLGWGPIGHALVDNLTEGAMKASIPLSVTILCEEPFPAYNRVKLTSFFTHRSPEKLVFAKEGWCEERGVKVIYGTATGVDRGARKVTYSCSKGLGGSVNYHDLVFATGSTPFVPPIPGLSTETKGITVYRNIGDCNRMIEWAKSARTAVVVGGGFLGLEAAKALYDLGLQAHILEMAPHILPVQVDQAAGDLMKQKVEALGLKVHAGVQINGVVTGPSGVTGVKIVENGKEVVVEAGLVCVSAGIRPRDELAKACGLEIGVRGGVKVNDRLCSVTDEHVYAVGEIAAVNGEMPYGLERPGMEQAKVLAANLLDRSTAMVYPGSDLSTKLKLMGVPMASFGGSAEFWRSQQFKCEDKKIVKTVVKEDKNKGTYKKLVFTPDGRKLLGGILLGDLSQYGKLHALSKKPNLGTLTAEQVAEAVPTNDGGDGTNIGDDDNVCSCKLVTKGTIKEAIKAGAITFDNIRQCTKAGTGCGGCINGGAVPKILANTLKEMRKETGLCPPNLPFAAQDIEDLCRMRKLKTVEEVVDKLGPTNPTDIDKCKPLVAPILGKLWDKPSLEGDHVGQLKALRQDLFGFIDKQNCNPILVRLAWHDCGTFDKSRASFPDRGGANGSIRFAPEISMGANNGLNKALKLLEPYKKEYPLVSWADLIQMASAVSIEHAGGPKIQMRYGRKDAIGPEACPDEKSRGTAANAGLPDGAPPYGCGASDAGTHLRNIFYRMGFNDQEIVALSGAHTLGRAFKDRSGLAQEGYGEAEASKYTGSGCPVRHDGKVGVGMPGGKSWTKQWLKFDNSYFKEFADNDPNLLWLETDKVLTTDPEFKKTFDLYAKDQAAFFRDYAAAHKKLSELGCEYEVWEGITID